MWHAKQGGLLARAGKTPWADVEHGRQLPNVLHIRGLSVFSLPASEEPPPTPPGAPVTSRLTTAVNAVAFVHMSLAAHETKSFTLEEMDDVFDSGVPAWRPGRAARSRLEELEMRLESESKAKTPASADACDGPETPWGRRASSQAR